MKGCSCDTSFGEASPRTQATDPTGRETLRIRTPLPGIRGEAKWLRKRPDGRATPWSAKALTREVRPGCTCRVCAAASQGLLTWHPGGRAEGGEGWDPVSPA